MGLPNSEFGLNTNEKRPEKAPEARFLFPSRQSCLSIAMARTALAFAPKRLAKPKRRSCPGMNPWIHPNALTDDRRLARQTDLALAVDADALDGDLVAQSDNIFDLLDATIFELGNVHEAFLAW